MPADPIRSFRQYQERYLPSTVAKPETAEEMGTRIAREALDALAAATPCGHCGGKDYDPEARVGHLNANPTTPESIEAVNAVVEAVLRRFAPCPLYAPVVGEGNDAR